MGIIAKIRRIDWLQVFLWIAVIGCVLAIVYGIYIRDFNIFIPVSGTLVAIIAVILIYREMNLKNRPFLCITNSDLTERIPGSPSIYTTVTKNCGVLPAKEVTWETQILANGKLVAKSPHIEPFEIYPDQCVNGDFIHTVPKGKVSYFTRIEYKGPYEKTYWYTEIREIHPISKIIYLVKVIST